MLITSGDGNTPLLLPANCCTDDKVVVASRVTTASLLEMEIIKMVAITIMIIKTITILTIISCLLVNIPDLLGLKIRVIMGDNLIIVMIMLPSE